MQSVRNITDGTQAIPVDVLIRELGSRDYRLLVLASLLNQSQLREQEQDSARQAVTNALGDAHVELDRLENAAITVRDKLKSLLTGGTGNDGHRIDFSNDRWQEFLPALEVLLDKLNPQQPKEDEPCC